MHKMTVSVVDTVRSMPYDISIADLYKKLQKEYQEEHRFGITCFEYFDSSLIKVKPHLDCEHYLDKVPLPHYQNQWKETLLCGLNQVFNVKSEDWALSTDSRLYKKNGKTKFKISYHFILTTVKCDFEKFKLWMIEKKETFRELNIFQYIDYQIYRIGINKFRLQLNKKNAQDSNSLLIPFTFRNDFTKHLVQVTEGLPAMQINL